MFRAVLKLYAGVLPVRSICAVPMIIICAIGLLSASPSGEAVPESPAGPRQIQNGKGGADSSDERQEYHRLKTTDELLRDLTRNRHRRGKRFLEVQNPDELLKYLVKRKWYRYGTGGVEKTGLEGLESLRHADADLSAVKRGASEDISNIVVLLGEIPASRQEPVYAPVFITDKKKVFGTRTDLSFTWVGYKSTLKLSQKRFPWRNTTLNETIIGSFLFASGTNLGFVSGNLKEETRFYTNYISEIITLTCHLPLSFSAGVSLDSRQYFFVERDVPDGFIMPLNHYNLFPRIDLGFDRMSEKGIDQLTEGMRISTWIGYGVRNRWEPWGDPSDMQSSEGAKTFTIYSLTMTWGVLFAGTQNVVVRARIKGGIDNDFLTRPRFGGTIDNAGLDVVHGFTIDSFRVDSFALVNARYGYDLFRRLRLNLFFDYARVIAPDREDVVGGAYGVRITAFGGLPIWLSHGIGMRVHPRGDELEQVVMVMTAAGW